MGMRDTVADIAAGFARGRSRSVLIATLAVALLAGCADGPFAPPAPLMSPLAQVKDYGYAERDLPGGQIEVSYLGPVRRVPVGRADRAPALDRARGEAEELALWRAAQVVLARNAKAFEVVDRRADAETEVRERFQGYSAYHYYVYRRGFGYYSYFPYDPFLYGRRDAYAQARAHLVVKPLDRMRPGAYDADATAARLKAKWGGIAPR